MGLPRIKMTEEQIKRLFNAREPTDEEWAPIAAAMAERIRAEVDQGFIDEIDEMLKRK